MYIYVQLSLEYIHTRTHTNTCDLSACDYNVRVIERLVVEYSIRECVRVCE